MTLSEFRSKLRDDVDMNDTVGAEMISLALAVKSDDAKHWVSAYGNPLVDPLATFWLARSAGLNASVILETILQLHPQIDYCAKGHRATWALDMSRLLIDFLVIERDRRLDS